MQLQGTAASMYRWVSHYLAGNLRLVHVLGSSMTLNAVNTLLLMLLVLDECQGRLHT
jgi:hypothetical protein